MSWARFIVFNVSIIFGVAACLGGAMRPDASIEAVSTATEPVTVSNSNATTPIVTLPQQPNAKGLSRAKYGLAFYYGTGNSSGVDPNLMAVCEQGTYDIIILSFLSAIGSHSRNSTGYPEMQINGCTGAIDANNLYLGNCNALLPALEVCQAKGIRILISMGGSGAQVGFASDSEGSDYANMIWNLFLGGNSSVRPFANVVLDGVDLDIESGTALGYGAFVKTLRALMTADARKPYFITAAPQCPFPDAWMGPGAGTALTMAPQAFDALFVQFYNNGCEFSNAESFAAALKQWTTLSADGNQPAIYVGLPAAIDAADAKGFVPAVNLTALITQAKKAAAFGGLMFWDAGYDQDVATATGTSMGQSARTCLNQAAQN